MCISFFVSLNVKSPTPFGVGDLAERVGFEPTVGCPITSFQDWLLKPLGHLSMAQMIPFRRKKVKQFPAD